MRFINFLITIGFILETKCFATVLKLTMHKNAEERGLVCNDGSPGGYYAQLNGFSHTLPNYLRITLLPSFMRPRTIKFTEGRIIREGILESFSLVRV